MSSHFWQVQTKTRSSKTTLAASHSPDQPKFELSNPPLIQPRATLTDDFVVVEDFWSMRYWDRDSIVDVNEDNANQDGDKCDSQSDSWEGIADSSPELVTGDNCLTCSDTKDEAVKSACKKFHKRCGPLIVPLSRASGRMHSWTRSDIIATLSREVTTKPLKQSRISLWIGTPAPLKWVGLQSTLTSYFRSRWPPRQETSTPKSMRLTSIDWRRLRCSHSSNSMLAITSYMRRAWPTPWWACRASTWAMLLSALASLLKLFCPWCLKLGGKMEMITIHLCEVHYQMAIACDICEVFASMTVQNIQDHQSECKKRCDKEHMGHKACGTHRKTERLQDPKKEWESHRSKKASKL